MTDKNIVEMYFARSEAAIAETERLYGRYFYTIANGILKNDEDAREILNDTYVKAWNTIPPARPQSLKAYLGRIVRHLALDRLEKYRAQKRGGGQYEAVLEELLEFSADTGSDDNVAEAVALKISLNAFVRSLPDEQRRVFIRRYWYLEEISVIASDLSMGESKVKSMLARIRKKLREHLNREGFNV